MSNDESIDGTVHSGQVKWFDCTKGYGFVVAEGVERDILLHANVLRNFGQNSVADGATVKLRVIETDRGMQAQEVLQVSPPEPDAEGEAPHRTLPFDETLTGGDLEPARVLLAASDAVLARADRSRLAAEEDGRRVRVYD